MISKNCYVPVLELVKLNVAKQIEKIVYISSCINNESSVDGCWTFFDVDVVRISQAVNMFLEIAGKMFSDDSGNKLLFKGDAIDSHQPFNLGLIGILEFIGHMWMG